MSAIYCVTWHGTVVCRDGEGPWLHHRTISSIEQAAAWQRQGSGRLALASVPAADRADRSSGSTSDYSTVRAGVGLVHLKRAGYFVRALPDGTLDESAFEAQGWETFLLLSEEELRDVLFLMKHCWVARSLRSVVRAAPLFVDFSLRIGSFCLPLAAAFPILLDEDRRSAFIIFDGWKIEELVLFRPLIYYAAFGARHVEMARYSIDSFHRHHRDLDADFLIVSNSDLSDGPAGHEGRPTRVHSWRVQAACFFDYCIHRYKIYCYPGALGFQPLLYLDTDVMFTGDVTGFLVDLVLSGSIQVGEEAWSLLASSAPVGSTLFQQDGFEPKTRLGFNSGLIGIPNLRDHGRRLLAVVEIMNRHADTEGQWALTWFDQSCANYVWAKIGGIEGASLTPLVENVKPEGVAGGVALGFVHFWGSSDKLAAMQAYVALEGLSAVPRSG